MKRLAWLLLLAFGTALAQVPVVDVRLIPVEACGCCEAESSACGMPECAPSPTCAQPAQLSAPSATRVAAKRAATAPQVVREKFYVQFLPRVSAVPALPVTSAVAPPASVPLFRAHCSFLI